MANPALTLDTNPFTEDGYVGLTWTNATKGSNWYSWRVYRRPSTTAGKWTLVKEYLYDTPTYVFHDYWAASNVAQEWIVIRVHLVSSVPTEEAFTTPEIGTPESDNYWLVHPYNIAYNLKLFPSGESFSIESEVGEMNIIGRGRRIDYGTVWGRRGSLACQLRDRAVTASEQLRILEAQQNAKSFFWLRDPWSNMLRVRVSDLQVQRIAGVGLRQFADITFAYSALVA